MVHDTQNYWVSGLCPSSGILNTGKHNVSATGSVSVLRLEGGGLPLCWVRWKELIEWLGLDLNKQGHLHFLNCVHSINYCRYNDFYLPCSSLVRDRIPEEHKGTDACKRSSFILWIKYRHLFIIFWMGENTINILISGKMVQFLWIFLFTYYILISNIQCDSETASQEQGIQPSLKASWYDRVFEQTAKLVIWRPFGGRFDNSLCEHRRLPLEACNLFQRMCSRLYPLFRTCPSLNSSILAHTHNIPPTVLVLL
jgi:hypothetical protein